MARKQVNTLEEAIELQRALIREKTLFVNNHIDKNKDEEQYTHFTNQIHNDQLILGFLEELYDLKTQNDISELHSKLKEVNGDNAATTRCWMALVRNNIRSINRLKSLKDEELIKLEGIGRISVGIILNARED